MCLNQIFNNRLSFTLIDVRGLIRYNFPIGIPAHILCEAVGSILFDKRSCQAADNEDFATFLTERIKCHLTGLLANLYFLVPDVSYGSWIAISSITQRTIRDGNNYFVIDNIFFVIKSFFSSLDDGRGVNGLENKGSVLPRRNRILNLIDLSGCIELCIKYIEFDIALFCSLLCTRFHCLNKRVVLRVKKEGDVQSLVSTA